MGKSGQITIKHIAHEAGVSIATVSNVLNGNINEMRQETLLRVQAVIRRLNYRPNAIARGLVTRRTATVGLILAEIETPLFLQALTSIERGARDGGYGLLLLHARSVVEEREAVDLLMEKQADGIIFLSTSDPKDESHIQSLRDHGSRIVLINRASRHKAIDQVNWDNETGVYAAVDNLARIGHRRIAHLLGPPLRAGTQDRLRGYKRALKQHGLPYRAEYVQNGDYTAAPELWRRSTRALLAQPQPPTAIVASDDTVAAVVLETLRAEGVGVPAAMSVIGIDDQPSLAFLGLTTVQLPVVEAGRHAIELLIRRMANADAEVRHIVLPCELIERGTAGPPSESLAAKAKRGRKTSRAQEASRLRA